MSDTNIKTITAVTEVRPEGQKCVRAVLEYDREILGKGVTAEAFLVADRTVTDAYVTEKAYGERAAKGRFVCLELSPEDAAARTFFEGNPWEGREARTIPAKVIVSQTRELAAADGSTAGSTSRPKESDGVRNLLVEEFSQGVFDGLAYHLYIPKDYDPSKRYPLVQFIHDAAICSHDVMSSLAQGVGGLVWMTPEAQKKHPCFVLVPQFEPPTIVEDDWSVDERLETEKRLLDYIVRSYSIDPKRLYTTGQSMGCMSSMVLNIRYPDLFAASLFVAGQWDENAFRGRGLEKKPFWFINSMGDAKAFPIMNQILVVLEQEGANIARQIWKTGESQETYRESTNAMLTTGANILYTPYDITTVANGWHSNGGEHHVNTWRHAYLIDAIHDWLFAQSL